MPTLNHFFDRLVGHSYINVDITQPIIVTPRDRPGKPGGSDTLVLL
jgi:hypothetical protein